MNPDETPLTTKVTDDRCENAVDRVAYIGMGGYSVVNILWIIWVFSGAGFGIFNTAIFIGIVVPAIGLLSLIGFQCSSPRNKFSVLANVLSVFVLGVWFLSVWLIVAAASSAV